MNILFIIFGFLFLSHSALAANPAAEVEKKIALVAMQNAGRIKPFDTFAREGLELLTGKQTFAGKNAVAVVLSFVFEPQKWQETAFIQISHLGLKKDLALNPEDKFFSPKNITHSPRLMALFSDLDAKQKRSEKLDPYFQAVQRLANQLMFLQNCVSGSILRFFPPQPHEKTDTWRSVVDLNEEQKLRFTLLAATYVNPDPMIQARASEHVDQFFAQAEKQNPGIYPPLNLRQAEVNFNSLHPFRWAWIFALMAAIALGIALVNPIALWYRSGLVFYIVSLLWQIYGFSIRCWIAGRPPVSNMYESIIWVAFGCMFFGLLFEWIYRKRLMAIGAAIFGLIALIIADNTGAVVDDSIHPLEPVLRSNLWLTVHVLTITLGYAAYALSLVLGNLGLLPYVFLGRAAAIFPLPTLSFYSYRAVQVGTFLLTAGTILGGVWADYSWGRFWGWDPKETWALIALLGYLALIHARMFGLVNHFTFLFWAVVAFLGVLMAWYGVNFILGVGLHSYGFSSGGVGAVAAYSSIQLLLLTYAYWQYRQEKK